MRVTLKESQLLAPAPQRLRLELADVDSKTTQLKLSIIRLGELRDDWVLGTCIPVGAENTVELEVTLAPGLYQIAEVSPVEGSHYEMEVSVPRPRCNDLYFVISDNQTSIDPAQLANDLYAKRQEKLTSPLVTPEAMASNEAASKFQIIVFFSGLCIHRPQEIRGCSIRPLSIGMGIASLNEVVSKHLEETLGEKISFSELAASDFKARSPLFAVHIENLWGVKMDDALAFGLDYSTNIAALIGVERGEKPIRRAVFYREAKGVSLYPVVEQHRGNLMSPMFANDQAELLERYLPALQRSPRARLDLYLLIEAISERDTAIKVFRYWAILEMIAARHNTPRAVQIRNMNGGLIVDGRGRPRTTSGKSEMVYEYLRQSGIAAYGLGWKEADGRDVVMGGTNQLADTATTKVVSLWQGIRAVYKIRNSVAHDGYFRPDTSSADPEEVLASRVFTLNNVGLRFLVDGTQSAVSRELSSIT